MKPARVRNSHLGLGNQEDEKINWSSGIVHFMLKGKR